MVCSLEGMDTASIVCPEVSGARYGSRRHPTCYLSCSTWLGNASYPPRPNHPGRASWNCRAGPQRRNRGTGAGGQGCSSILARKATNVLIPPRHRGASTRSMGEGLIVLTHG